MANLNTTETENYSQLETRILQAIPLMTRENQRILLKFVEAMVSNSPKIDTTGALQDVRGLLDALMNLRTETLCDGNTARILAGIAYDKVLLIQGDAA